MSKMRIFGLALGVVALVAMAQPAQAACGAPFLITSINQAAGYYAYVYNPSVTDNGLEGSSITDQLTGFFWGVGVGNPAAGVGADNGTFAALDWLYVVPGYPASVLTTWAASTEIDTCIDVQGALGSRCQVTLFQDVDLNNAGAGMFALLSTPDDPASGDFFLDNGGVPITLAPAEGMSLLGSARAGDTGVELQLSGPSIEGLLAGSYLSDAPACQGAGAGGTGLNGLITGYIPVTQVLPRGSAPPSDFDARNWNPAGAPQPLGSPAVVSVGCDGDSDVYVSYQLTLDSGFVSPLVSASTTRVECGPNVANPSRGNRVKPEGRSRTR